MTYNLKVIDISHYQNVKSFQLVRQAGIVGVILKATQGTGMHDITYNDKRIAAKAAGLLVGSYHFCSGENVNDQLNNYIHYACPKDDELISLDFEDNPKSPMSLEQSKEFLAGLRSRLGRIPKLYSGNRVKDLLGQNKDADLAVYPLWLPEYGPKAILPPTWTDYFLWQYSEKGIVSGIVGNTVDLNSFEGTDEQLKQKWV